jgi:hypothetical protein
VTTRRLSPRQLEVLTRLMAGEVISRSDSVLAVSVYALRNRKLVETIKTRGGHWTAELTEDGLVAAQAAHPPAEPAQATASSPGAPAKTDRDDSRANSI